VEVEEELPRLGIPRFTPVSHYDAVALRGDPHSAQRAAGGELAGESAEGAVNAPRADAGFGQRLGGAQ
jgi:hypothetical protein